jgi:hypothetical protein
MPCADLLNIQVVVGVEVLVMLGIVHQLLVSINNESSQQGNVVANRLTIAALPSHNVFEGA